MWDELPYFSLTITNSTTADVILIISCFSESILQSTLLILQCQWDLLSVRFFSIVLNDLRSHERRRSSKTLSAGRQHGSTHSVVRQLDDRWNDRVRVWANQRPHKNVLRLEVTVDDLLTVQVAQCCCHLVADNDINVPQTIMTMMMMTTELYYHTVITVQLHVNKCK